MASPEPAASTPRSAFARLRRNKGAETSTLSLVSSTSDIDDKSSSGGRLMASVDRTLDKVKDRARKSTDERRGSLDERSRLSGLISSRRNSKRKNSHDTEERLDRSLGTQSGGIYLSRNPSDTSFGANGSSRSSLLTDDLSDSEIKPTRPTITPHDSHSGLLTLSSPLIHAQTSPSISPSAEPTSNTESNSSAVKPLPNVPHIIEPLSAGSDDKTSVQDEVPAPTQKRSKIPFGFSRKRSDDTTGTGDSVSNSLSGKFRSSSRRSSLGPDAAEPVRLQEGTQPEPSILPDVTAGEVELANLTDSKPRPQTPTEPKRRLRINSTSLPATPPNIQDTPITLVTPPTPTISTPDRAIFSSGSPTKPSPSTRSPGSIDSLRHRRGQLSTSNIPSKLSNSIGPPLTPTAEELKTPGGTLTSPQNTGFFSNFFTAAQKAANQLTDSIGGNQNAKSRAAASVDGQRDLSEVIPGVDATPDITSDKREPAVDTLGQGSLSLSHLGINESGGMLPMNSTVTLPRSAALGSNDSLVKKEEEDAAARAVSAAYEQPVEKVVKQATGSRPLSIASTDRLGLNGESTPSRSGDPDHSGDVRRQGSVRSKLSGRRRRHRASSATTGGTVGNSVAAGITSSLTGLGAMSATGPGHRLTGFAVASSKRNKDFHALFRSVPEDDYLIEDYSAALQRDILLHGRLYVSECHICFSSNILGWVTNLVINFDEVVSIEKKSTAVIFPNALVLSTLHAKNTFASFVARDSTYELLIGIWKINHPNLKSSLNGVALDDAGTGDKTEKAESIASEDASDSASDEVYDEDEDDDDTGDFVDPDLAKSPTASEFGDNALSRKTSAVQVNGVPQPSGTIMKGADESEAVAAGASNSVDYPGPQAHPPTECTDTAEHYDRLLADVTIQAPLGRVFSMMFGPASGAFMKRWLVEEQKSRELDYLDDKIGLDNNHKTMTFSYIKPLNAPVGPRQTKCITTNTLETFDLEKSVTVSCSTQTPDVPNGNIFTVKTRYCLMWGPGNSTRMIANCTIEWTGKSWLKGAIEKGAQDGQSQYAKDIVAALKAAVMSKSPAGKVTSKKGRKKGRKEVSDVVETHKERHSSVVASQSSNWGPLEIVRPILEPLFDIVRPMFSSQVIIALLLITIIYQWLRSPRNIASGVSLPGFATPERLVAYEEIWRREESELWDWLEDRVGLDGQYVPSFGDNTKDSDRQKVLAAKGMEKRLANERMSRRDVDDAIRTTEQKLEAFKEAVKKQRVKDQR
ncbi:hypothetical protein K431DRAFT_316281 [Polychaeton citri CBS 116435]|uniref:VASt domain-containing protein n=1 Tax=Polychaeton citri CBS 116435 TaxID=1314669 RepID=A0A9P4UJU9_9PEZI|nr:hypothetical protein K431DRAFT_316281 [Polychaeton citri CBS 116435]